MNSALSAAAATSSWNTHDTRLLVVAVLGIALIVVLIAALDVHPFLALVLGRRWSASPPGCRRRT